ncbi:MAG: hypothetical protein EOM53_05395 [Alphaproteobacteria bacterium]|nr:hypothetical protein [Alphaproteobacteria bacterium]
MRLISHLLDTALYFLKWPIGILSLFLLLPSLQTLHFYYLYELSLSSLFPFLGGLVAYGAIFFVIMQGQHSIFSTAEHEITHMLFALLTGHRPLDIDIGTQSDGGGFFAFKGRGNFLITLAPYFFPTFAFFLMLATPFVLKNNQDYALMLQGALGFLTSYHFFNMALEIHPDQTDLQKEGFLYAFFLLPTLNILTLGYILSFAMEGQNGLLFYTKILYKYTNSFYNMFLSFI